MEHHDTTGSPWPVYVDNARRHISSRSQIENRTKQGFPTLPEKELVFKSSAFDKQPECNEEKDKRKTYQHTKREYW